MRIIPLRQNFCVITILLTFVLSLPVLAVSEPIVIEEFEEPWSWWIKYTVVNPADSSIGDIVGFVVETDFIWNLYANATNGWLTQGITERPLSTTNWDLDMKVNYSGSYPLTWRQFFGGIDYPFGDAEGVGYFVSYFEVPLAGTFQFDWAYSKEPYHLPILPGETLGGFNAYVDGPCSQYLLAYMDDAENDTFSDSNRLSWFRSETIPEPATIFMLGLGGLAATRRRGA